MDCKSSTCEVLRKWFWLAGLPKSTHVETVSYGKIHSPLARLCSPQRLRRRLSAACAGLWQSSNFERFCHLSRQLMHSLCTLLTCSCANSYIDLLTRADIHSCFKYIHLFMALKCFYVLPALRYTPWLTYLRCLGTPRRFGLAHFTCPVTRDKGV